MKTWKTNAQNRSFIASFSGGKDSSLALYYALKQGHAVGLITMMEEKGQCSRAHRMSHDLISAQAASIGLPLLVGSASWEGYEAVFKQLLNKASILGADVLVTGDIDVPSIDCWHERVTSEVGLDLAMPLWEMSHEEVVNTFLSLGFKSKIVTINLTSGMNQSDLGRILTTDYIQELKERGIDPCGEAGEFHTTVIDGPIFSKPIAVVEGEITTRGDYMYLPLYLNN
ncbi:MAG: diphthine--ammonia ligase [Cellulosilyticaceae bacterium]